MSDVALYRRLIAHLAELAVRSLATSAGEGSQPARTTGAERGLAGDVFEHQFMSTFKYACFVLAKAGIAEPIDPVGPPGSLSSYYYRLRMDLTDVPTYLANRDITTPPFAEVVGAALHWISHNGPESTTQRDIFEANAFQLAAMEAFADAGYAERHGDRFRWTDKIGPHMVEAGEWDEAFRSHTEMEEEEAAEIVRTMPAELLDRLSTGEELEEAIKRYWANGRWNLEYRSEEGARPVSWNVIWRVGQKLSLTVIKSLGIRTFKCLH